MKCLRLDGVGVEPVWSDGEEPVLESGSVRIQIRAAALNHRDVWLSKGLYPGVTFPVVPGSDGCGVVVEAAPGAEDWLHREVVINPSFGWGEREEAQGEGFTILGMPRQGTFAERIVVPTGQVAAKPGHLDTVAAGALPLAGLTAWRSLFSRARVRPGERVLVTGIGGGVALFALQFALAAGARVAVTSGSAEKLDRARALGAEAGFNYRDGDWANRAAAEFGRFDVAIDGGAGENLVSLIDAAAPGARIVNYGATGGNPSALPMRKVFWNQLSLLGSTMGSPADFAGMVAFVERHGIRPVVDSARPMAEGAAAFARMDAGEQFGKLVLVNG
jgi:NADPH:quinone reductase-like Zn-dependent oxidoreductase